jgi:hypothetical protein
LWEVSVVGGIFAALGALCFSGVADDTIWAVLLYLNTAMKIPNKFPQVYVNYVNKSTGSLSAFTFVVLSLVCLTNIITFSLKLQNLG